MIDPLEIGLPSGDEIQRARKEFERDAKLEKANQEFDNFFARLELETGAPVNTAALETTPAPFAARISYSAIDESADDELQPMRDFIKSAKQEARGPITNGQIRRKLASLGNVLHKVAGGL